MLHQATVPSWTKAAACFALSTPPYVSHKRRCVLVAGNRPHWRLCGVDLPRPLVGRSTLHDRAGDHHHLDALHRDCDRVVCRRRTNVIKAWTRGVTRASVAPLSASCVTWLRWRFPPLRVPFAGSAGGWMIGCGVSSVAHYATGRMMLPAAIDDEQALVRHDLKEVAKALLQVEVAIDAVEAEIKIVMSEIKTEAGQNRIRLQHKEDVLRQDKAALRQKEAALRQDKAALQQKDLLLLQTQSSQILSDSKHLEGPQGLRVLVCVCVCVCLCVCVCV
jgi:hypothetical protein